MSTITREFTKERLIEHIKGRKEFAEECAADSTLHPERREYYELTAAALRIALASLEAEPAYFINRVKHSDAYGEDVELRTYCYELDAMKSKEDFGGEIVPVYTAPPAPVSVPDEIESTSGSDYDDYYCDGWNACRAAMLQGKAAPRNDVRQEHAEWSQSTFGDVGPVGPLKHLSKEALEAAAEPGDLSEWADMQFLLWDAQRRAGISDEQITQAMIDKLAVNKSRQWPEPEGGEPRLHIKAVPQQE